ncbi:MAG: hypothetical protein V3T70_10955, partial [Phycisphaerae bacterium]
AAYVFMISVLEEMRRAVRYSGSSRALIEAALVRLSETSNFASIEALMQRLKDGSDAAGATSDHASRSAAGRNPRGPSAATEAAPERAAAAPASRAEPVRRAASGTGGGPERKAGQDSRGRVHSNAADGAMPAGRPKSADIKAALAEPAIRQALEMFDGHLVQVRRTEPPAAAGPRDASPAVGG